MGQAPVNVHSVNNVDDAPQSTYLRQNSVPVSNVDNNCRIFSNLKCLYSNCDGLFNKRSEFIFVTQRDDPSIILLTETKLHKEILNEEVFPTSKYDIYRKDRDSFHSGGGVCILVKK